MEMHVAAAPTCLKRSPVLIQSSLSLSITASESSPTGHPVLQSKMDLALEALEKELECIIEKTVDSKRHVS